MVVSPAVAALHEMARREEVPAAVYKEACEECSLFARCLPKVTSAESGRARARRLAGELFRAEQEEI